MELREYRALPIGLEVDVASLCRTPQDSCFGEHPEFALHGPVSRSGLAHDLAEIEPLLRVAEEPSEYPPPCTAEQDR